MDIKGFHFTQQGPQVLHWARCGDGTATPVTRLGCRELPPLRMLSSVEGPVQELPPLRVLFFRWRGHYSRCRHVRNKQTIERKHGSHETLTLSVYS